MNTAATIAPTNESSERKHVPFKYDRRARPEGPELLSFHDLVKLTYTAAERLTTDRVAYDALELWFQTEVPGFNPERYGVKDFSALMDKFKDFGFRINLQQEGVTGIFLGLPKKERRKK